MIDAHHHLWAYNPKQYCWIGPSMKRIARDFLPGDLEATVKPAGITGVVSVQARQIVEETRWLLELASGCELIKGVVGWVPLIDPDAKKMLEPFVSHPKLKAIRHVLQGEPSEYMLRDDFNRGVAMLKDFGLRYDVLIFENQLPQAIEFVDRHPELTMILDHVAKPRIKDGAMEPWRKNMFELARRPNVYCKISGMVTEADWAKWTPAQLDPYFDVTLEAFGPRRLMFGSDWPVCLVATEYANWVQVVKTFIGKLAPAEQRRIESETAVEAYGLK